MKLPDGSQGIPVPDRPPIRRAVFIGVAVIVLFLFGMTGWAAMAPLQSAAIAPGSVSLDTYRKTIQHLEGGIVSKILVREGEEVEKGDVLVTLDETQAKSRIQLLEAQIASETAQLDLLNEEIRDIENLYQRGLAKKSRVLGLQRRKVELEGDRTEHLAALHAAKDVILRSQIKAPITGAVVGLQIHTKGGVIKPGDALMSIVPKDEPLVVEARVDPNDIDVVQKGMVAQVRLTPLNTRDVAPLDGKVIWISADRMTEKETSAGYYLARIKLDNQADSLPKGVDLYPGMPAEVMILTGERSLFGYLSAPITRSFRRAFREQ